MTPLVLTVIIPVYKTAATLDRCVESVLSQADGCELILVDDGSPDSCGDLCDRWAERSDRISVVHQPNRGLSAARNSGIARSHAPYVTFVDSDDVLQPHTLPPLLALLAAHPDYDLVEYPVEIHYGSPRCLTPVPIPIHTPGTRCSAAASSTIASSPKDLRLKTPGFCRACCPIAAR